MPAWKFTEVHWPTLDHKNPGEQSAKKTGRGGEDSPSPGLSETGTGSPHVPAPSSSRWSRRGQGQASQQSTTTNEEGVILNEAQTTNQIHPGETPLPFLGGNGSSRHETARDTPAPAAEKRLAPALLEELTGLESRCVDLAGRLSEVVQELLSGNVQGGSLPSDLTALRADAESLRQRTVDLAGSLGVPTAGVASSSMLGELRATLKSAAEAEERRDFRLLHARAAQELESVLALECRAGNGSNPLDEVQSSIRRLLETIAAAEWPNTHPESQLLAERRHACSRLLDLIRQHEELSDDDWQSAEETVAASFGRRLAVAAVRGRLRFKNGSAQAKEDRGICPACGAELESGAKFCGDCGVKIE